MDSNPKYGIPYFPISGDDFRAGQTGALGLLGSNGRKQRIRAFEQK
jgi:hypothetical protein